MYAAEAEGQLQSVEELEQVKFCVSIHSTVLAQLNVYVFLGTTLKKMLYKNEAYRNRNILK